MDFMSFTFMVGSFAQDVAGGGPTILIDLFTNIGMAGVFIFLYWDERKERREAQKLNHQILERTLPLLAESAAALERVQQSQAASREIDQAEMKRQIDELKAEIRRGKGDA